MNLVVRICIYTKDYSDTDYTSEEFEREQVTKTDKLTSEMGSILHGSGAVLNMDNYYMSTTAAINLKNNGVYCRGTIRTN